LDSSKSSRGAVGVSWARSKGPSSQTLPIASASID
jgi:hypothetical protein